MPDEDTTIRRRQLYGLLGDLPPKERPISVIQQEVKEEREYQLEKLVFDLNGDELVPAFFVKPLGASGKLPTILYFHSHRGGYDIGKEELLHGNDLLQSPPYANALTSLGFATLCYDAWCFGERHSRSESETFKKMLWNGQVLWGMMVYDAMRAIDYLVSRPDVNADRIGVLGMSMGSTMAWWTAALDERIKVCVDICCLTDFQALLDTGGLDLHGLYYFVPGLLKHFTTGQINALIAPRHHLSLAGLFDPLTPPIGLDRVDTELRHVYHEKNAPEAWELKKFPCGHLETEEMRQAALKFLDFFL